MTELQWHFSVPLDQRARRQFQRWIVGRVGKGSRSSGCLVMVVLLLFAPRSLGGFRSRLPLRLLLWSRLRVVRQVGLPVRSGRDTRGLGCAAAAVVVMARGVAGGSLSFSPRLGLAAGAGSVWVLPRFFSRSVRTQDARGCNVRTDVTVGGGRHKNRRGNVPRMFRQFRNVLSVLELRTLQWGCFRTPRRF